MTAIRRITSAGSAKRIYHLAAKISPNGDVSPACAATPRAIDMRPESRETWTTDPKAVTCRRCRSTIRP